MTQSRTHTCGELRLANAGETVTLVGWMENIREVGNNFAFLVLRDFYGTTQVVIENEEMMNIVKPLNKESTISVTGIVRERTSKNPKLPTGDIEIAPTEITVLGRCRYNELPFEINHSREADESQRLKYRYLDLRNPEVKANIILRCNVVSALRTAMTEHGFLEITTPILTRLLESRLFDAITVMMQKEVALRLCAAPGTADYGAFTVFVQYYSEPEILFEVPRGCFVPQPKVSSAVVRLHVRKAPPVDVCDEALFFRVVRASFAQRRKQLLNGLSAAFFAEWSKERLAELLTQAGVDPRVRGETLSLARFADIANVLYSARKSAASC